jgi:hypothetical protein
MTAIGQSLVPVTFSRRRILIAASSILALGAFASPFVATGTDTQDALHATVYKSPTCGCCGDWVKHLEANGFHVDTVDLNDLTAEKERLGVPRKLHSCHTAEVGGYTIEGHVPADDIKRLLTERLKVRGLSVPGMPHGSPGMETGRVDPYAVISFDDYGNTNVFSRY